MVMGRTTNLRELLDKINEILAERGLPPRELRPGIDTSDSLRAELRQLEGRPTNVTIEEALGGFLQRDPLGLEESVFGGLGPQPTDITTPRTQEILRTGQPFPPPQPLQTQPGGGEFDQLLQRAQEIAAITGRPVEDVFASLTGTPTQVPAEDTGITEFQQAQLDFQNRQLTEQTRIAEQQRINALRGQFGEQAARRGLGLIQRSEADIERAAQERFSSQFESFRQQVLSGTAPRGFFAREALRGVTNPFTPDPLTIQDRIGGIGSSLEAAETSLNTVLKRATAVEKRIEDRDNTLTRSGVANPSTQEEFRARAVLDERTERESRVDLLEEQLGRAQDEFVSSGEAARAQPVARPGGFTVGGPAEPVQQRRQIPIPRGLSEFLPEGIGGRLVTPSAQAFGRLSFTEREQLLGGVQFRGGQPTELLERIQAPLSPRRRGGRVAPISFV